MKIKFKKVFLCFAVLAVVMTGCGNMADTGHKETLQNGEVVETTMVPEVADIQENTETPKETVTPEVTEMPQETATPEVTEMPQETAIPDVTEAPQETVIPDVTEAPQETVIPETTETPEETATPEENLPVYTYTELSTVMYAQSEVNVRSIPSADGVKIGRLSVNEEVSVTGQCNETEWYRILYENTVAYVSNNYLASEKVEIQVSQTVPNDSIHNYYKNLTSEQAEAADAVAKQIADSIMSNAAYTTDLERVNAAAQTVAAYCGQCTYGSDAAKWYRSPYGVFVGGVYTCAGSTRALGRVLDFMGFNWQHVNENQNAHQWCVLVMDGQTGFADGMGGFAGYGEMISGMTLPDGRIIYF
ncbi:MAG: SH3 domain-containing protein [Lachnospiraceae bacterium]|nr:SH3 domain-containing protein [Lachnospiraceae bacterium]